MKISFPLYRSGAEARMALNVRSLRGHHIVHSKLRQVNGLTAVVAGDAVMAWGNRLASSQHS